MPRTRSARTQISARIPEELKEAAQRIADKQRRDLSEILQFALEEYVARRELDPFARIPADSAVDDLDQAIPLMSRLEESLRDLRQAVDKQRNK